jgi:acetate kinase
MRASSSPRRPGGDESAALALELFVRRAAAGIAGSATVLPGIDAVVFTSGIGEHSGLIRHRIVGRLAVPGVRAISDASVESDGVLGEGDDGPLVLRIEAREDLVIAGSVRATLKGGWTTPAPASSTASPISGTERTNNADTCAP